MVILDFNHRLDSTHQQRQLIVPYALNADINVSLRDGVFNSQHGTIHLILVIIGAWEWVCVTYV